MLGVEVSVAREGYDRRTAEPKNMAFTTDYYLPLIYKCKRSGSTTNVTHGLSYAPRTFFFREVSSSPLVMAHTVPALTNANTSSVTTANFKFRLMTHYDDFETTPYGTATDAGSVALAMINPLGTPIIAPQPLTKTGVPVFKAGGSDDNSDYNRKLHTYYDTFKVHSSGTITLNASSWTPNASDEYDVVSASYTHNLGYIPFFTPKIPYQTSLDVYYQWYWAWHKKHEWSTATEYVVDDYVTDAFGTPTYKCIKWHTSSSTTEPNTGANWSTYWVAFTSTSVPTTIVLNNLEDIKFTYGGASVFDDEIIEVYATTTQLVVKLHRVYGGFGYNTFPARTITMNYTTFYNKLNEDFDLLD
jgi:hypothetical protein